MKYFTSLFIYYILLSNFIFSDSGILIGNIIDADTHTPLEGANIFIESIDLGTFSDKDGEFYINLSLIHI